MGRQLRGKGSQLTRERNALAWQAWHIASWSRSKKIPPLRRALIRDPNRKPQRWQQMKQVALHLTRLYGGEVKGKS